MAVKSTKVASSLKLTVIVGIDKKGKEKHGTKKLGNIKTTAVDEDLFAVGQAISNIKNYPLVGIDREDEFSLVNA
ncbi:DUF1659 domain-containing protein [Clostridium tagluense]|uniref:DUF1659 domain-containing protein n=1 Tax=Clostridium tagluense TaxID=360422 RepID=A0A401UUV5_9CLOT|nr:DUF1659 domain-containing protein [Clostridium tagluense]MBU3130420.1 DUF1659 domain-containing protein [Clostridium tagluense]MCB2299607.1 DUF1659 domain-containing protein [Clostridium tagluense]MCB2313227.1 DUF1659 domain-containing protein [Clostridium tagluense]MCB2318022.1 DUF1659 domain-containing protein [Clostridium tagluense]MCB2322781.1 DUF1659 domain-containing protein [Clostridium tagluense]